MLKTRSYEIVRSSGNLIQWRKRLFDTVLVYNNKNKPKLRYKFGSVYNDQELVQSQSIPKTQMGKQIDIKVLIQIEHTASLVRIYFR